MLFKSGKKVSQVGAFEVDQLGTEKVALGAKADSGAAFVAKGDSVDQFVDSAVALGYAKVDKFLDSVAQKSQNLVLWLKK